MSEYCLLMALIALIALGIFVHVEGGIQSIWSNSGTTLTVANTAASGNSSSNTPASNPGGPAQ